MRRFAVLALWACALGSVAAQSRKEFDSAAYYKKWLEQDVIYIITDEEMAVFKSLTTDEERDQFIEQFWLRRDKTPETAENEYKIEHYRRILYANEKFTAGIPGWKTDRGRIYIMFGPPDRYMSQPQGGSYVRERKEGGGLTSVAPFERWEYRHIDGIGDDVELEFVDDKGGGLYELTFDNQRKDDLLQLGFMGPTLDEIEAYEKLGVKRKQDRVAGRRYAGDLSGDYRNTAGFETHKDAPFQKLQLSAMLNKPPEIRFKDLEAVIGARVSYSAIPLRYDAGYVRISDRQVMVPVTLEIPNSALTFKSRYGIRTAKVQVYGQATTLARRRVAVFEDEIARDFSEDDYESGLRSSSLFQKQLVLAPGLYKLEVVVKDLSSGHMTLLEQRLEVPDIPDEQLALSSIILARSIEKPENPKETLFTFGSLKVVPKVDAAFRQNEEMGFYFQVYGLQVDPSTAKPKARVEFAITPRGKEPAAWRNASDLLMAFGTHATVARIGSLSAFQPGDYDLKIRVTDLISGREVSGGRAFSILNPLP